MFKRPLLSNANRLVNGSLALSLLFMAAACDNTADDKPRPEATESETSDPLAEAPSDAEASEPGISLPAVWSSADLGRPIQSVAVAGGLGSMIAVSFDDGAVQLLNFEGERVTDPADLNVAQLGDGTYALVAGAALTVFPGIDDQGGLNAYLYGGDIQAPIAFPLDIGSAGRVKGLCTGRPLDETDGLLRLAFWTEGAASRLQSGRIVEAADKLVYLADDPVEAARPITACVLEPTGAKVFSAPVSHAVSLERNGRQRLITLDQSDELTLIGQDSENTPINVRDGITVRVPNTVAGFAGTGDARGGGYPGGLIVMAGAVSTSEHRAVLVDPSELTLAPLGVPVVTGQD